MPLKIYRSREDVICHAMKQLKVSFEESGKFVTWEDLYEYLECEVRGVSIPEFHDVCEDLGVWKYIRQEPAFLIASRLGYPDRVVSAVRTWFDRAFIRTLQPKAAPRAQTPTEPRVSELQVRCVVLRFPSRSGGASL
jgi:hypothetical protein